MHPARRRAQDGRLMRCPACGATNPDGAAWCGQCYRRFDEPAPPAFDAQDIVQTEAPAPPPVAADALRRQGDDLLWTCPQCDHENPIEVHACEVCGTAFIERFREPDIEPPRNWSAALAMSVLAPGAGHIAVGRYGTGIARLTLFAGSVVAAAAMAGFAGAQAALVITPLVLGALILWAGSIIDVYRAQQGERELLAGRALLWLVVGVLVFMGLGLFGLMGRGAA